MVSPYRNCCHVLPACTWLKIDLLYKYVGILVCVCIVWTTIGMAKLLSQEATKATQSANLSFDAWCGRSSRFHCCKQKVMCWQVYFTGIPYTVRVSHTYFGGWGWTCFFLCLFFFLESHLLISCLLGLANNTSMRDKKKRSEWMNSSVNPGSACLLKFILFVCLSVSLVIQWNQTTEVLTCLTKTQKYQAWQEDWRQVLAFWYGQPSKHNKSAL